ncbi:MAG: hypothetical protein EHM61_27120 [Acidobacteria bacterium]|nr:MAG: hypothetical protein EHM61_27120 [Acidobacteriota bacterium]
MSRQLQQTRIGNKTNRLAPVGSSDDDYTESSAAKDLQECNDTLRMELEETKQHLATRAGELRRTTLQLATAEQRERDRLARVLHDDLQQLLLASLWHLQTVRNRVPPETELETEISHALQLLRQSIEITRSLSKELSPPVLEAGLFAAIGWLVQYFQDAYSFDVSVEAEGSFLMVPDEIRDFAFQSIRELLINSVKHSKARHADLQITNTPTGLEITISDRGRGFNPAGIDQGFGLPQISSRVTRLGGDLKVKSRPGRGATFRLTIPYSEEGATQSTEDSIVSGFGHRLSIR